MTYVDHCIFLFSLYIMEKYRNIYYTNYKFKKWAGAKHFLHVMNTCKYSFDPVKAHFYIVKLGSQGMN